MSNDEPKFVVRFRRSDGSEGLLRTDEPDSNLSLWEDTKPEDDRWQQPTRPRGRELQPPAPSYRKSVVLIAIALAAALLGAATWTSL